MNTINNKFSFSRFAAVLKCDLMENWLRYVGVFAILFFANLAYQLVDIKDVVELSMLRGVPTEEYMGRLASDCVPFFYGVLALALMCAAADMTAVPFKTKGRGMNYLMMPATNMEKFLSRAFINVVMVIVMAYVALFLADLARMLYVAISDIEGFYGFTFPTVWNELIETFPSFYRTGGEVWGPTVDGTVRVIGFSAYYGAVNVTTMVAAFLFAHSLFILGGCIWRKAAIIKIWITQLVVTSAVVWIFVKLEPYVLPWLGDVLTSLFETEQRAGMTLLSIAIPVLLALTALNWWLGYRLFSRKQAVAPQHRFGGKHLQQLLGKK
jgi:hypothetical protein